jgi:plasmid stabilization system protein ParE
MDRHNVADAIAHYIAVENRIAAAALVQRVFGYIDQLEAQPERGLCIPELKRFRYRQIVEPPCHVIYRFDGEKIFILHVMRSEQ